MNNEKKLRLIQVAKEFKVGLNTITDFLHKKGVNIDVSPNAQITADVYEILEKEFGANRPRGNEREKISLAGMREGFDGCNRSYLEPLLEQLRLQG